MAEPFEESCWHDSSELSGEIARRRAKSGYCCMLHKGSGFTVSSFSILKSWALLESYGGQYSPSFVHTLQCQPWL